MANETLNQQGDETSVAQTDYLALWDVSAGTFDKATVANVRTAMESDRFNWELLGRAVSVGAGDIITVSGFTTRKYMCIYYDLMASGSINGRLRFNNDSTANYSVRSSIDGAADSTTTSTTSIEVLETTTSDGYGSVDVMNVAGRRKFVKGHATRGVAAVSSAPARAEVQGKWGNTSSGITRVDIVNTSTGDFVTGSELVVLGHD